MDRRAFIRAISGLAFGSAALVACSHLPSGPSPYRDVPRSRVDVLIVGAGIMGLSLARALRQRGLTVAVLEAWAVGSGQTCHSHVYIHQGHVYAYKDSELAAHFAPSKKLWQEIVSKHSLQLEAERSYFGFATREAFDGTTAKFKALGLEFDVAERVPDAILGGNVRYGGYSPEYTLDASQLMRALAVDVQDSLAKVDSLLDLEFDGEGAAVRLTSALVECHGTPLRLDVQHVVFCTGMANQSQLLRLARDLKGGDDRLTRCQMVRKGHMLVLKGSAGVLPRFSGVFPDLGDLFIGARREGDQVVWLVSDARSPRAERADDWRKASAEWWLPDVIGSLRRVLPASHAAKSLQWGVYEAPKAEPSADIWGGRNERVEQLGAVNTSVAWPTKLTLAPALANRWADEYARQGSIRGATMEAFIQWRRPPMVAPELWRTLELAQWDQFASDHGLPS